MENRNPLPFIKTSDRFSYASELGSICNDVLTRLAETDEANIPSDDELESPKEDLVKLGKCTESFESAATPQTDFKSTKESICQVPQVMEGRCDCEETLSPGPPVYFEFNENLNGANKSKPLEQKPANYREEDIMESVIVRTGIHRNMVNHSDVKTSRLRQKENILKVAEAIEAQFTEPIEGTLEKKSFGLLNNWKLKYCRMHSDQLIIYKNWETKLQSGVIDFRLFPCLLACNPGALSFK